MAADYKIRSVDMVRLELQDRLAAWLHSPSTCSLFAQSQKKLRAGLKLPGKSLAAFLISFDLLNVLPCQLNQHDFFPNRLHSIRLYPPTHRIHRLYGHISRSTLI